MNNKLINIFLFLLFIFLQGCSFDKATGLWDGYENEEKKAREIERKQKESIEIIKVYEADKPYAKEISADKGIILSTPKKTLKWLMSGNNLQNSLDHSKINGISNNFIKKKVGKNKFSLIKSRISPLYINNNLVISDNNGSIFLVGINGKILWKQNIYKKVYKKLYKTISLSIDGNIIYAADNIGFVYSIDINNGSLLWIKNYNVPIKSEIKVYKGKIFIINQDNRIFCLNTKDGSKIWDIRSVSSFIKSQSLLSLAISKDDSLIVLNSYGDLMKIQVDTGKVFWSTNTTSTMFAHDTDFFQSSSLLINKNNIIFSTSTSTFSYNLENGYLNWEIPIGSSNLPIIDNDNVFVLTDNGYLVNLQKNSGEVIFSKNILKVLKEKKRSTKVQGFVLASNKIYAVSLNGFIIVSSAITGKPEYFKKIGDPVSAPPIISNGSLFVLTNNSKLLGFN